MVGEDVAVEDVLGETAKSVLGRPGVNALQTSVDKKALKPDQGRKNRLHLVEERSAPTYTKHGIVIQLYKSTANSAPGRSGALVQPRAVYQEYRPAFDTE